MNDTILIVDDNPGIRRILARFLKQNNYPVVALESIQSATSFISQSMPTLVIVDIKMPRYDGIKFIHTLRKNNNSLPIIAMTAYPTFLTEEEALKIGANAYIIKPFEPSEIIKHVQQLYPCKNK